MSFFFLFYYFILYILEIGILHQLKYIPAGICHCQKIMLFAQSFKHGKWVPEDSNLLHGMCHQEPQKSLIYLEFSLIYGNLIA